MKDYVIWWKMKGNNNLYQPQSAKPNWRLPQLNITLMKESQWRKHAKQHFYDYLTFCLLTRSQWTSQAESQLRTAHPLWTRISVKDLFNHSFLDLTTVWTCLPFSKSCSFMNLRQLSARGCQIKFREWCTLKIATRNVVMESFCHSLIIRSESQPLFKKNYWWKCLFHIWKWFITSPCFLTTFWNAIASVS